MDNYDFNNIDRESLLHKLQQQGILLDKPWNELLSNLSPRITNALRSQKYISLYDVVIAVEHDTSKLLHMQSLAKQFSDKLRYHYKLIHLPNFGQRSLDKLQKAIESLLANDNLANDNLGKPLLSKLKEKNIPLDVPWNQVLPNLSPFIINGLRLQRYTCLYDVVMAVDHDTSKLLHMSLARERFAKSQNKYKLLHLRNFSKRSLVKLQKAIENLLTNDSLVDNTSAKPLLSKKSRKADD